MNVINNINYPTNYLCLIKTYRKARDIGSGLLVQIPKFFPEQQGDVLEEVKTAMLNSLINF
jgi:hypothetical protein